MPWLHQPLDPKKKEKTPFEDFVRCHECGFGSVSPLPKKDDVPAFYDLDSYYTQGESHIPQLPPSFGDRVLTKLAYLADRGDNRRPAHFRDRIPANAHALDIGAGGGGKLKDYAEFGWTAVGVEPDPSAMSRFDDDAPFTAHQGTAEDVPEAVKGVRFDLISMTHVLEHCIDPIRAVKNVRSLLKDDGLFWCEVPNCECVHFEAFNICSEMFDAPRHLHFYTTDSLRRTMEKAGLAVEEIYYHGFCRHHHQNWRAWEREICRNTRRVDPDTSPPDHTFLASAGVLAKSMLARPALKYDCVGLVARKA